jgi:protein disulfide-isomerase
LYRTRRQSTLFNRTAQNRLLATQGYLPEAGRVKVFRFFLLLALVGTGLLALPGCGQRPESADSSSPAQPTPSTQTAPTKAGWLTNYEEGQQEAKANNKLVLLDFTGSDWCGWCITLDREVFSKPQFKEYASKNLVLVEVDFPKMKPLSESIREQNIRLAQQYQIQAFPTIIVLNGSGQVVGELGYMRGGPDVFIAVLEKLRKG